MNETQAARHAINHLLAGNPPNGVTPSACGPWAETVTLLYAAHADGGTPAVRRMYETLARSNHGLAALVSSEDDGWGPLISLNQVDLPVFPLDIFPGWLHDFTTEITEAMQTPPDLAGMLAFAILSTAAGGLFAVQVRPGWDEPVNVYTVTSLPPGSRKSPVFRSMTAPLVAFEQDLIAFAQDRIIRLTNERDVLQQQLEAAKREAAKNKSGAPTAEVFSEVDAITERLKETDLPVVPKLIVDDITPEALSTALAEQKGRIAALSSEGDLFAIMAGRYSSGAPNLGVFLKGHAGDPIRVDRRNRSEMVTSPALTVGITTQPDVLRSFSANAAFRGQGLLARFFYALPKSTVGSRAIETTPVQEETRIAYHGAMRRLLLMARGWNSGDIGNSGKLPRPDFWELGNIEVINNNDHINYLYINEIGNTHILDFQSWLEPRLGEHGELVGITDWASKLVGGVIRIAGLLHLAALASQNSHNTQNDARTIPAETVRRAVEFSGYLLAHAQAAYAEIGANPATEPARVVLRWLEKTGTRTFTKRDAWQAVRGGVIQKSDDLDPALELLTEHNYIREMPSEDRAGPGRKPSTRYEINPRLTSQNSHNTQNR